MKRRTKGIAVLLTIAMLVVQITATTAYAESPVPEDTTSVTLSTEETVVLKEGEAEEAEETVVLKEGKAEEAEETSAIENEQQDENLENAQEEVDFPEATEEPEAESEDFTTEQEAGATQEPEKSEGDTQLYVSEEDLIAVNAATDESLMVAVQAENANPANQPKTSAGVDVNYSIKLEDDKFKIFYDIGEDAEGDVVLDFSTVLTMIDEWYQDQTGDPNAHYLVQPSDYGMVDIEITTSNGHTYRYQDGSFRLETQNTSDEEALSDFVGFDGQRIPIASLGAIAKSTPMCKLFDVFSGTRVKLNHILNMADYLADAGYTGETALTDYLLNYYNNELGTSYANFSQLAEEHPEAVADMQGGMADDQFSITEEQYADLLAKYPDLIGKYSVTKSGRNGRLYLQVKWNEKELGEASYNLFYKELLSFAFGDEETRQEFLNSRDKWHLLDQGVRDYMEDTSGTWSKVNDYFAEATAAGLTKEEASKIAISMAFGVDGPWTTNSYQLYKFGWYNSIIMEQVDGDVTVNKVDSETGELITDPATFKLYYYKMELGDEGEQQVTYYYAIDENGNGYFTTDESAAALLVTENGSFTVKYLLTDVDYILKEVKAPGGYVTSDDITFTVKSKETTIIDVPNSTATPEPTPTPTPTPNVEPTPTPTPVPSPSTEPTPTPTPEPSEETTPTPTPSATPTTESTPTPKPTSTPEAIPSEKPTSPTPTPGQNDNVPKTGSTNTVVYWATALIVAATGAITVVVIQKKRRSKKDF